MLTRPSFDDALSGLARAFFFTGERSLSVSVSQCEVNSNATVKLITKTVDELKWWRP